MVEVNGNLPAAMLKAYTERLYAVKLLQHGEIRLGHVNSYRDMESATKEDKGEGEAKFLVPGKVPRVALDVETGETRILPSVQGYFNFGGSWHSPFYAFCCSKVTVNQSHQKKNLGPHIVEIFDVPTFIDSLRLACQGLQVNGHRLLNILLIEVAYDKGNVREIQSARSIEAFIGCKPPKFYADQEVRVVLWFAGPNTGAPKYVDIRLSNPTSFCRWWTSPKN